jgi:hypothetical protein
MFGGWSMPFFRWGVARNRVMIVLSQRRKSRGYAADCGAALLAGGLLMTKRFD